MLTIHRSKGLEFPVVYCPDLWEPTWIPRTRRPRPSPSTTPTGRGRSTSASPARSGTVTCSSTSTSSAERTCGSRTSRSRARSTRRSCGGRARSPAATRRWRGCCSRATATGTWRRRAPRCRPSAVAALRAVPRARRPGASASSRRCSGATVSWPGDVLATRNCPRPRSTARSTGGGGGRPSATSPPAPTRRAWRASPRRPSSTTSPRRTRRRWRTTAPMTLRAVPSLLAEMPVGVEVGTLVHRVFESTDFAAADLDLRAGRAGRRRTGAPAASSSATSRVWSRACGPRSRRRWGRWRAGSRCATSRARTGSTSSTSSCRWSAATTRAARR